MGERQNATSLTDSERDAYIDAVKELKNTIKSGHTLSIYDEFVAIHWGIRQVTASDGTADRGHNGPAFLPWHREYLLRYEQELQNVNSDVTLPYWRWDAKKADTNDIFKDEFMGPSGSGWGSNHAVTSGHFSIAEGWEIHADLDIDNNQNSQGRLAGERALQRNNTLTPSIGSRTLPGGNQMENVMEQGTFSDFRSDLENAHNTVHVWVGESMVNAFVSPNDPIFFMHHCNVDRLWAIWQQDNPGPNNYNPDNNGVYGDKIDDRMWPWDDEESTTANSTVNDILSEIDRGDIRTPRDVLDIGSLGFSYDDMDKSEVGLANRCFIATAAYGSELAPPVQFLRDFRDKTVLESRYKESFQNILDSYYRFSPPIAKYMSKNNIFKQVMKYGVVWPFVGVTKTWAYAADKGLFNPRTKNFLRQNNVLHKAISGGVVPTIKGAVKTCEFIAKHSFAKKENAGN